MAAAVGSLMSVSTCSPAAPAHSFVALAGQALAVGGDGDDALVERLAQPLLGVALELAEQHDGDLLGAQRLADERHALAGAQDALDRADRALLVEVLLGLLTERQTAVAAHR